MIFESLARWVTSKPRTTIFVVLAIVAACGLGVINLNMTNDFDGNLPQRSRLGQDIRFIERQFESRNSLAFMIAGADEQKKLAASCALAHYLERLPGIAPGSVIGFGSDEVKYVASHGADLQTIGLDAPCASAITPALLEGLGPQRQVLFDSRGDLLLYVDLNMVSNSFIALESALNAQLAKQAIEGVHITYAGQPMLLAAADRFALRIVWLFPIVMAVILALHWEALRSVQAVVIPITTGLLATAAAVGLYCWLHLPMDAYATMAPIVIIAVGAGHSVQLLKRYMEEARDRADGAALTKTRNIEALIATIATMGPVLTLAVLGASACLFSLLLLDVSAMARFGFLAGAGLVAALILELTLIPAIRALLPTPVVKAGYGDLRPSWARAQRAVGEAALTAKPIALMGALVILVVVLGYGLAHVRRSTTETDLMARSVPERKAIDDMSAAGVGVFSFDVLVDGTDRDGAFEPALLNAASGLEALLAAQPHVRATASAPSVLKFLKCRFMGADDCAHAQTKISIGGQGEGAQLWDMLFNGAAGTSLIDESGRYLRVRAFLDTDESRFSGGLIDKTQAFAAAHGLAVKIGGSAVTPKALGDGIVQISFEKSALLIAIVLCIGGATFASARMAFLFAVPALVTILSNFSYLGWSGAPLNFATAAIASVAVGVSVDYLIYMSFRLREFMRQGQDFETALRGAHASAGGAAICVGSAVAIGYGVLFLSSDFSVHQWTASLVPLTMLMSLFGALFLFPVGLRFLRPKLV